MYQISSDGGKLIPEGSWDYQLFTGQEDDDDKEERYGFINLKYGIFDNLSMGLHSYTYPETDVSGLEFVWKPVVGLYLTSEHMFSEGTMGNAFAIEGTYLPSSFRFETRFIDENSPIIDIQSSEKKYPEYSFLRYSINSAGWYLRCQYTDSTDHMKYESIIKKKVMRNLTLSTENSLKTFKDNTTDDFKSNIIIAEIMLRKHNIRLSWNIDTYQSLSYRYQPGRDAKYYWSASYNRYETNNEYDAFLSFTYKFGDFLTTQISLSDDYRKIENSLEGIISGSKGPEKSDQYAMGTLYGVVKTPGDDKSPSIAIEGATVMAGSRRAVTDKNGNYIIHGLPVDQRVVFSVLPSTLDVGLTPKQEFNVFKFRPGTIIEYNPIFQKTVGIDGVILFDGTIPAGAEIYAHHIETDRVVATGEIDPDGFFVIEGIIPGLYNFEIKGIRKDDAVFEYLVKGDEDWISELKLKVKTH
ncbi:MAG: carboxypeptidase regulatory-like domain-containing protein [Deltaproteobacteria bacterium]|nr:carboxypeptidase regulatory-like domain-containing protein [Deltaproteobacteria bacterium]